MPVHLDCTPYLHNFVDCREKGVHEMKGETYYKIMTLLGVANLILYCIEIFK